LENGGKMNNSENTLRQFFSYNENDLSQKRLSEIESDEKMSSLKEVVSKEAKEISWPAAFNEIIKNIGDLLNIGIPNIMVMAWNKYRILLKYLDSEKYSPDETFLVPLAEHTIKSEHRPYIEILVNEKQVGKIEFNIDISLTLKGIILKIRDGRIKEILTGTCKGKGTIRYGNLVITEKETGSFTLPGSIELGNGIPIAP